MSEENRIEKSGGVTFAQVFGQRLDAIMNAKRVSNKELAAKIGVTAATVAEWRRCEYAPFMGRIRLVAKSLGVTTNQLLGFPARGRQTVAVKTDAPHGEPLFDGAENEIAGCKKETRVRINLSAEERRLLEEHCEQSGEPVSAFVRQVVLSRLLGEKDRRLHLDLDKTVLQRLSLAATVYGETVEQIAARILQEGLVKEFRVFDTFCDGAWQNMSEAQKEEARSLARAKKAREGEPCAAERTF